MRRTSCSGGRPSMDTTTCRRCSPFHSSGNRPHRARHQLRVDAALGEPGQDRVQLAIPDQWLAPDDRQVHRPMLVDEGHEPLHQLVALVVRQTAQRHAATEVFVAVGVAAGAAQRTFAGDLDRKVGSIARKDPTPSLDHLARVDAVVVHVASIMRPFAILSSTCQGNRGRRASRGADRSCTAGASLRSSRSTRTRASSITPAS